MLGLHRRDADASVEEICGDRVLAPAERRRYLGRALRQVRDEGEWITRRPLAVNFSDPAVRASIAEGASPLRVYTAAVVGQVAAPYARLGGPVCDIGCGGGSYGAYFDGTDRGAATYLGVDLVAHSSWNAAVEASPVRRRFAHMCATRLGLRSVTMGLTFSSCVLEHVADLEAAVHEIARVTRPGAFGVHVVPSVWSLFLYMFHGYRRFSRAGMIDLFARHGLEVRTVHALGGLASFVLHAVWITWLRTGAVFDWIAVGKVPGAARRLCSLYLLEGWSGTAVPRRIYRVLLRTAVRLDRFLPLLPVAYCVVVHKPGHGGESPAR